MLNLRTSLQPCGPGPEFQGLWGFGKFEALDLPLCYSHRSVSHSPAQPKSSPPFHLKYQRTGNGALGPVDQPSVYEDCCPYRMPRLCGKLATSYPVQSKIHPRAFSSPLFVVFEQATQPLPAPQLPVFPTSTLPVLAKGAATRCPCPDDSAPADNVFRSDAGPV